MTQGTAPAMLADRYGTPRPGRGRRIGTAAAVLTAALVGWAGWVAWSTAAAPVRWQDGAFTLVDAGRARLTFDVTTDPGHLAVCTVRIFNSGLTEVGRQDVPAGPSTSRTFSVTADVPTFEAAASGTVRACAVRPGPARPTPPGR